MFYGVAVRLSPAQFMRFLGSMDTSEREVELMELKNLRELRIGIRIYNSNTAV